MKVVQSDNIVSILSDDNRLRIDVSVYDESGTYGVTVHATTMGDSLEANYTSTHHARRSMWGSVIGRNE